MPWQKVYVVVHLLKAVKAVAIQIEDQTDKDQSKSEPQNQTIYQWERYEEKDKIQAILVKIESSIASWPSKEDEEDERPLGDQRMTRRQTQ